MIVKEREPYVFWLHLNHESNSLLYLSFGFPFPQPLEWPGSGRTWDKGAEEHEVHLARPSQVNAAAGLGTSVGGHLWLPAQLFERGPAKAPSVEWRQVASWAANTFWHGLKEHLVPLCGPTTEGQRMCLLAATWWAEFLRPDGPALTITEKNPPSFSEFNPMPTQEWFCSCCVEIGQWGHLACLEMMWRAVRQEQALGSKTRHFRGGKSLYVVFGC